MAQKHGQIQEFDPDVENITAYLEHIDLYFIANGVEDDKRVAVLLSVIGGKIYSLLRDLLAPAKPQDKSIADLKSTLKDHFDPTSHWLLRSGSPSTSGDSNPMSQRQNM